MGAPEAAALQPGPCHFCLKPGEPLARCGDTVICVCRAHHLFLLECQYAPVIGSGQLRGDERRLLDGLQLIDQVADRYPLPGETKPSLEPRLQNSSQETPLCLRAADG
jgi:hypothetical protein